MAETYTGRSPASRKDMFHRQFLTKPLQTLQKHFINLSQHLNILIITYSEAGISLSRSNRPKTAKYVTQMLFCFYSHERQTSPGTSLTQSFIFAPKNTRPAGEVMACVGFPIGFLPRIVTFALFGTSYSSLKLILVVNFKMQSQYVKKPCI